MSLTAIISALVALAKAVPALSGLCEKLIGVLSNLEEKRNERVALERLEQKNADVDAALERERLRASEAEQRGSADETK